MDREYTHKVIGCVYEVYRQLGPGLLESIYEKALTRELQLNGFQVENQVQTPVYYKGELICPDLRLDLMVDRKLILELKSVVEYKKIFEKQLFTYLRLTNCELGYVINFTTENIRDSIYTVINPYFKSLRNSGTKDSDPLRNKGIKEYNSPNSNSRRE